MLLPFLFLADGDEGIALRMAYSLGLHVNPKQWVESGHFTVENAEIRSIAWWGCYMIER